MQDRADFLVELGPLCATASYRKRARPSRKKSGLPTVHCATASASAACTVVDVTPGGVMVLARRNGCARRLFQLADDDLRRLAGANGRDLVFGKDARQARLHGHWRVASLFGEHGGLVRLPHQAISRASLSIGKRRRARANTAAFGLACGQRPAARRQDRGRIPVLVTEMNAGHRPVSPRRGNDRSGRTDRARDRRFR